MANTSKKIIFIAYRDFSIFLHMAGHINRLDGLDPSSFFMFAHDFRPLRANHYLKLKFGSATLHSFKRFLYA